MSKTDAELRLIGQLTRSLEACPEDQRVRVLEYLNDRFAKSKVAPEPAGPSPTFSRGFLGDG